MMAQALKNLYNQHYIQLLATNIHKEYSPFGINDFTRSIFDEKWEKRELKERMRHISTTLQRFLPKEYAASIDILKKTFLKMNHAYTLENIIFQDFVALYGLDALEISLDSLAFFTINSTSEFAIREFICKHHNPTMQRLLLWAEDKNEHIRRLASEGSRPRLPWAIALPQFQKDPSEVLLILEKLKDDESAYVRKSVANNLNEISKDNPEQVKKIAAEWIGHSKKRDALLKHACRTLLKQSNTEVLTLFGYNAPHQIQLTSFYAPQTVNMGTEIVFNFKLTSQQLLGKLRIAFAIEFLRKNNTHNTKVFHIADSTYSEHEKSIKKHYSFKPISTRVYYKGLHRLKILVNGVVLHKAEFMLL